ncbi:hypothetical protein Tco_1077190 [Tanacetum coccineum]
MTKGNNTTFFNEYVEADQKAKRFEQESQSQFIHDRDVIRDLEQQRDKLDLSIVEFKRQIVELQKTRSILKRKMSESDDIYHDTVLDLEARAKKNEDVVLKMGNSLQGMFMLGPKPMSFYDSKVKHGLGYKNPYTLKKTISQNPKLYDASCLDDSKIQMNVRDSEDILDDATKSQITMKRKSQDPIAIEKKQNVWTIDYKKLNALYENFVPQKEFSVEQKYFSSSFISFENSSNASSSYSSSETKPTVTPMPSSDLASCQVSSSELRPASYRLYEDKFLATCEQELCPFGFLLASCQVSSSELRPASYRLFEDTFLAICEQDFSKLEIAHLNLQLKHQHLKENIENFKSKSSKDVLKFDTFFELGIWDDQIQGHRNTIPLQEQLEHFKAENEKVKQHYQELFNSIKITRVKTIERTTSLQTKIENLKTQLQGKMPCVTSKVVTPKVSVIEKYAIEVESIPATQRNNRDIHHHYLNRLRDTLDTLREIVEQGRSKRPSDNSLEHACVYTKRSQELLGNVHASCPKESNKGDNGVATIN